MLVLSDPIVCGCILLADPIIPEAPECSMLDSDIGKVQGLMYLDVTITMTAEGPSPPPPPWKMGA